ncbi:MAG: EAL domain-containing protein [Hahellaceae bacterium]|nr:EAL domain-containing protein [Hahellaceae bacterium]
MKIQFDFRQVADSLDAGVVILDSGFRVIYFNNWMYARSGMAPERVLNLGLLDIFPDLKDSRLWDCCKDAIELRLPTRLSNSFNPTPFPLYDPKQVGNELYRLQQMVLVKPQDVAGEMFCEIIVNDVTPIVIKENWLKRIAGEQRQEALLREQEQSQLSRIIDHTADAILVFQQSGQIDVVNQAAEKMFGYNKAEIKSMGLELLLSGGDEPQRTFLYDRLNLLISQAVSLRRPLPTQAVTATMVRKNGEPLPAEIKFSSSDSDGRMSIITIIRDRSAEVESERILRESENRFKTLAKVAPVGIFRTDAEGILQYANEMWFQITGRSLNDLHSESWLSVVKEEQREEVEADWGARRALAPSFVREFVIRRKNPERSETWVLCHLMPEYGLHQSLTGYVGTLTDISEQRRNQDEIERLAYYDSLTGLANRRFFKDRLERSIRECQRGNKAFALFALDLDEFKRVNDSLGHDAGDRLLVEVARRLQNCLREVDTIARIGGDEFSVILPGFGEPENIVRAAARIIQALHEPVNVGQEWVTVSTSIGITLYPADAENVDGLIKNADLALYSAKDNGRNGYAFFDPRMNVHAEMNLVLENRIRRGIANDEFLVYLQPQVRSSDCMPVRAEALVRWRDPARGILLPAEFIQMAEKVRLIKQLGEVVLEKACSAMQHLLQAQVVANDFRVAINISASQFLDPAFPFRIWSLLNRYKLPPQCIELEVTEGVFISDLNLARRVMSCVKGFGVAISLDDFGTGYSSLSYLSYLPVDTLKIDRSFISALSEQGDGQDIVLAIIDVAQRLRCEVVAEGVETEAQFQFLRQAGCDLIQGYWIAKPMDVEAFEQFIRDRTPTLLANASGMRVDSSRHPIDHLK